MRQRCDLYGENYGILNQSKQDLEEDYQQVKTFINQWKTNKDLYDSQGRGEDEGFACEFSIVDQLIEVLKVGSLHFSV